MRINPDSLARPRGYSNGVILSGTRTLFVAGQIGWDASSKIVSDDFAAQYEQALRNALDVVRAAGGAPSSVGRMTTYVSDRAKYTAAIKDVGRAYRTLMVDVAGGEAHYPAMSLFEVAALLEPGALVEVELTAILP